MIRRIDRYLFLSFLVPFVLCMVLILAMILVVETSERLSKLLKYNGEAPLLGLLGRYYLCRIPALAYLMAPIITLAGAVVALVRLARQNELMAMQASGVSLKRIAIPLLTGGFIAAALAAVMQELVVPGSARQMQRTSIMLFGGDRGEPMKFKDVFAVDIKRPEYWVKDPDEKGDLTLALRWDENTRKISIGGALRFQEQARAILENIYHAVDIDLQVEGKRRDRFWLIANRRINLDEFNDFVQRLSKHYRLMRTQIVLKADEFDYGKKMITNAVADVPNFPPGPDGIESATMIIDAGYWRSRRWIVSGHMRIAGEDELLNEPFTDRPLNLSLTPEDLGQASNISYRSLDELRFFARQFPSRAASLTTEIHKRLAYPFLNVILLLLAIPLVVEPSGQTSIKGIGLAVGAALGFYIVMMGTLDFGYRGYIPPPWTPLAAWVPLAAFIAIGAWMYRRFHG
ncbi:MAG TPA: LptF/LptG family permease [Planctomycetota bacterium]|nr:LptF/LptG family permease [Planctomycetota bacterium]